MITAQKNKSSFSWTCIFHSHNLSRDTFPEFLAGLMTDAAGPDLFQQKEIGRDHTVTISDHLVCFSIALRSEGTGLVYLLSTDGTRPVDGRRCTY